MLGVKSSLREQDSYTVKRGVVLVCVLVCLAVATALVTSTVQTALRARSETRKQRELQQAELLLEAGAQRAARELASDTEYVGETWQLASGVCGREPATVTITIETNDEKKTVTLVAHVPADLETGIQRSHRFAVPVSQSSAQE